MGGARTLSPGSEDGSAGSGAASDDWGPVPAELTTRRWQVTLDPASGTVRGLRHRATGREVLDGTGPLGEVRYALQGPESLTRGDGPTHSGEPHRHAKPPRSTLSGRRPGAGRPDLTVHTGAMRPIGLRRTYDGWRLRTVGSAPSVPRIEVDVLLRDHSDRVDVVVSLDKTAVLAKEALYVAFPFAAADPVFHYDRQQGWIDPAADHAPGACHDWFTTQHGVVVSDGPGPAVAWTSVDAPLFTAGDIVRGEWFERFRPASGALFSWVLNNYWPTNTPPEQAGPLTLRYAFTPLPGFDPVAAGRFGREVRAAVVATEISWLDKFDTGPRPLPAAGRLLDLDLPAAVHATVAEPRSGHGLLLRLQNLAGTATTVDLPPSLAGAVRCHADERPLAPLLPDAAGRSTVDLDPWQVATVVVGRSPSSTTSTGEQPCVTST
jgi:hypothetical protein